MMNLCCGGEVWREVWVVDDGDLEGGRGGGGFKWLRVSASALRRVPPRSSATL